MQTPVLSQLSQSALQETIQLVAEVTQLAHTVLSHTEQTPEFRYFPTSQESQAPDVLQVLQEASQETTQPVAVPVQVPHAVASQAKHEPELKYFPASQEVQT
jgi:hypothetical protein